MMAIDDNSIVLVETVRMLLPFISFDDDGEARDLWAIEESGNSPADFERGKQFARSALRYERWQERYLIGQILCRMLARGRFGPIEQGFVVGVSEAARAGLLN